jgi:hypothetical protein
MARRCPVGHIPGGALLAAGVAHLHAASI